VERLGRDEEELVREGGDVLRVGAREEGNYLGEEGGDRAR
jgi:hypothetical protein